MVEAVKNYSERHFEYYYHKTKDNKPWLFDFGIKRRVQITLFRGINKCNEVTGDELGTWWTPNKRIASQFSNKKWHAPYSHLYNEGARVTWKTFQFKTTEVFIIHPLTQIKLPRGPKMLKFLEFVKEMGYKAILVIPEPDMPVSVCSEAGQPYVIHPKFNEYRGYQWFIFDELEF